MEELKNPETIPTQEPVLTGTDAVLAENGMKENKPVSLAELPPEQLQQFYNNLYVLHFDHFCKLVDGLSSNASKRLLKLLVQYPLESKLLKTKSEIETNAYLHATKCFDAKYAIMFAKDIEDLGKILANKQETKGDTNEQMENK